jgi:hypothetical protein
MKSQLINKSWKPECVLSYNWNIVESGVKHHNPYPNLILVLIPTTQVYDFIPVSFPPSSV